MLRCVVMHETRDYTHRHFLFVLLLSVSVLQKSWEIQCCPMHSKRAKKKKKGWWVYNDLCGFSENIPEKTSILTRVNENQSSAYCFTSLVSGRVFYTPASGSFCPTVCSFSSPHAISAPGASEHISTVM